MRHEVSTTFIIHLQNGQARQHRFDWQMSRRQAQDHLDPLLDEMNGAEINSPVYVVWQRADGKSKTEQVHIYSPADKWDDPLN